MKKFISGLIIGAVVSTAVTAVAGGVWDKIDVLKNDITVIVNGENITADNFVYNDTTYLPLRAVSEALNQPVDYDETTNTAYIGEKKEEVQLVKNKNKYIPPTELLSDSDNIKNIDGIYYISLYKIAVIGKGKFEIDFDYDTEIITCKINGVFSKTYNYFSIDGDGGKAGIPYDTYVEEIMPYLQ